MKTRSRQCSNENNDTESHKQESLMKTSSTPNGNTSKGKNCDLEDTYCTSKVSSPNQSNLIQKKDSSYYTERDFLLPDINTNYIISISCGNTKISWAFLRCNKKKFKTISYWSTPHLSEKDLSRYNLEGFTTYLPENVQEHIFGRTKSITMDNIRQINTQILTYLVSTNPEQTSFLIKLLSVIPTKIYQMKAQDFYHPAMNDKTWYGNIGVDRVANLCGAASMNGFPACVIDGGTAVTYTATDCDGNIIGGSIAPGVKMKLDALHYSTGALPKIAVEDITKSIKDVQTKKKAPSFFSTNTKDSIIVNILYELASSTRGFIESWINCVGKATRKRKMKESQTNNSNRIIIITGGSGKNISLLLEDNYGGIIETNRIPCVREGEIGFKVNFVDNLTHIGIQALLRTRIAVHEETKSQITFDYLLNRGIPQSYVGKRVAKYFDGKRGKLGKIHYGSVTDYSLADNVYHWRVVYDDGDSEDYDQEDLKRGLGMMNNNEGLSGILIKDDPYFYVGHRVARSFGGGSDEMGIYHGVVTKYHPADKNNECLWHIKYEDGDSEDFNSQELEEALQLCKEIEKGDAH